MMKNKYLPAIKSAYLSNQIVVQFFSITIPVILKAHQGSAITLPLFASLSLVWCLRFAVVPWFLVFLNGSNQLQKIVHVIFYIRIIIVILLCIAAFFIYHWGRHQSNETILFISGLTICFLSGIERGLIDTIAMLVTSGIKNKGSISISLYEAFGVLLASTLSGGIFLAFSEYYTVPVTLLIIALLLIVFLIPLLRKTAPILKCNQHLAVKDSITINNTLNSKRSLRLIHIVYYTLIITFGWMGMSLAYRISQPLLLAQGISLSWIGYATGCIGAILLIIVAVCQSLYSIRRRMLRHLDVLSGSLSIVSVILLGMASIIHEPLLTILGFLMLKAGYFFFSVFMTNTIIVTGSISGSIKTMVFISGISYLISHFAIILILYLTTNNSNNYTEVCFISITLVTASVIGEYIFKGVITNLK